MHVRQEAQKKMGFYAAPPAAVAACMAHVQPPAPGTSWTLLDPCAGEGAALAQIAELLQCEPANVHAIELDEGRAATIRATTAMT